MEEVPFAAYVGIDWSDKKHDICIRVGESRKNELSIVSQKPAEIEGWIQELHARFKGAKIAVCLEQSRGALIAALRKYDFLILYPINPAILVNYRRAFSPSGAKSDPVDAEYLCELVQAHRDRLPCWEPEDEHTRKLQYFNEYRRTLVDDRTALSNKLTAYLKGYFPQILEWFDDIRTPLVVDFLLTWPTPESLKGVRTATLQEFFRKHHCRKSTRNEERIAAIRSLVPLTTDRAIVDSSSLMIQACCRQLKVLMQSIAALEDELEKLSKTHKDFRIFSSLPGAGAVFVPRFIAAFGTHRERFESAQDAATYFGIAPQIKQSGNTCFTQWRYFCPKFLRQTFHEFAGSSIQWSFWAEQHYRSQRAKGKSHHIAVRSLAFKWLRIIFRCWKDETPYNEAYYLKSLHKKGSSLLVHAATNPA